MSYTSAVQRRAPCTALSFRGKEGSLPNTPNLWDDVCSIQTMLKQEMKIGDGVTGEKAFSAKVKVGRWGKGSTPAEPVYKCLTGH